VNIHPVFPSILSTDYFNLESRLDIFAANKIDFIHLDVMDGHFVDNISFGPAAVRAIKGKYPFAIDSHLMVSNPEKMIPKFLDAGSEWVSFHIEATAHVAENIAQIKNKQRQAGLVLNPDTDIERAFPYLDQLDYILLMSVFPGYGGQSFIPATIERVARLKEDIRAQGSHCLIQVDGGIKDQNIALLVEAGADLLVIGTFLFNSSHVTETLKDILTEIDAGKSRK